MIDLTTLEAWFVTGSRHLYGEETLRNVAEHSREIAGALARSEIIPVTVVPKPVLTTPEAISDLCTEANASRDCSGHTAFTDHEIARRPRTREAPPTSDRLVPWRGPAPAFAERNLALATGSLAMLRAVQKNYPEDPAVVTALGTALRAHNEPAAAAKLFERVIELRPNDPLARENAGMAWIDAGDKEAAALHLEGALALDPLLLPDIDLLLAIYRQADDRAKEEALMRRVRQAMRTAPRGR